MRADPAYLIAVWFGSGLLPWAPGTWGSLAALPVAAGLHWLGGPVLVAVGALATFVVGVWAADRYSLRSGRSDPSEVVVDEVAAQLLVLAALPVTWVAYAVGFVTFRLADILKPWPASWLDREVHGGLGIMLDDIAAAAYAIAASLGVLAILSP